jgi:DNA-binding transcriptional MocR family regulator
VAQPGDIIITESPTFTCYLQLIEQLGLMALEIPTDPSVGIDLSLLEEALFNSTWRRNRVAACLLNPTFHNPLGFDMPLKRKQELVELLVAHQIPVIEDDIYGDLHFGPNRPVPLKRFDHTGMVLYCSSFSKTLAPDFRVGWIMPGRYQEQIARLQFNASIARSKLPQLIVADFLEHGNFDRHLRRLRGALSHQLASTARAIGRYFPDGTKLTAPNGGYILWVELDEAIDGMELYQRAKAENIFIIPGVISTSTGRFKNCIRISCGTPWNEAMEQGMERLGGLARRMAEGDG